MSLLIDGYNLLHASHVDPVAKGPTPLFRARIGLLNYLANALDEKTRRRTTIVFDAAAAPPGLPATGQHAHMRVHFARDFPHADDMIEELIEGHASPRNLLVVSGDHRLHRAARRRGAKAMDSDKWLQSLSRRRSSKPAGKSHDKPSGIASAAERAYWIKRFTTDSDVACKPKAES